jgi:hypothetical protein
MGRTGGRSSAHGRLSLRPGLRVVRRDDRHLQLGLDPPDRVVLPDLPGLERALTAPGRPTTPEVGELIDRLAADGWLVDAEQDAARRRQRAARRPPVAVSADPGLAEPLARAWRLAGVTALDEASIPDPRAVRLVATTGEPRRTTSDRLVRDDVPHLWLAVLPGRVRIGPFVDPGLTACLRCLDAHLGDRDPRRATVLLQLEDQPRAAFPPDPLGVLVGCAWAVRDVVRRLDGLVPSLRSATLTVGDDLQLERRDWLRHPHCGCAWGAGV